MTGKILKGTTLWLWGGVVYYVIELLYRGYSHELMFVVGGVCFLLLSYINNYLPWKMAFVLQSVIGGLAITAVELVSGIILNIYLGLNIWDYTNMPMNVLGQICVPFSIAWVFIAAFGIWLDDFLRWKLFGEDEPKYRLI